LDEVGELVKPIVHAIKNVYITSNIDHETSLHQITICSTNIMALVHHCITGNRKVSGSMPSWGFLLLLFPWARNFTPIASATQLLNRENIVCNQDTAEKQLDT